MDLTSTVFIVLKSCPASLTNPFMTRGTNVRGIRQGRCRIRPAKLSKDHGSGEAEKRNEQDVDVFSRCKEISINKLKSRWGTGV